MTSRDAVVIGSGPNGLVAGIVLARAGKSVSVIEAEDIPGGALRSLPLTLPGFVHDFGSAVHPLGIGSPFFRTLPLAGHGLEWVHPEIPLAHPLDDGTVALLHRSVAETAASLGADCVAYLRLIDPFVIRWRQLIPDLLAPAGLPHHPLLAAQFGLSGLRSLQTVVNSRFRGQQARALFAGLGAHSFLPLDRSLTAGVALMLAVLGHVVGWPFPRGGAQRLTDALIAHLTSLGGEVVTGTRIEHVDEVAAAGVALLDVTPVQILKLAGERLSDSYQRGLERYRYGPGVFKLDYALDGPIPWRSEACSRAGTVHLGGTLEEIAAGEAEIAEGRHPERPFVLLSQPTLFDPSRAPAGKHVVWAYCHLPNGSTVDMTARIEAQIERFAPGFRDGILARSAMSPRDLEARDANLVGGDISGGVQDLRQLYTRPMLRRNPYSTSDRKIFICSSSTPPGGGVHGMCGYFAARSALRRGL